MADMLRTSFIALLVAVLGFSQGRPVTPADQAAGQAWWAQVKTLADPGMEGRLTGSEGYMRAAKYVVSQFDSMGLQPAGVNGYYQPVKFDVTRVIADKSSVALVVDARHAAEIDYGSAGFYRLRAAFAGGEVRRFRFA